MHTIARLQVIAPAAIALALAACSDSPQPHDASADVEAPASHASQGDIEALKAKIVSTYAKIASATYAEARDAARNLEKRLAELAENPDERTVDAARRAWRAARSPYLQAEAVRRSGDPAETSENGVGFAVNAWPVDPAHLEAASGGLVGDADAFPEITPEALAAAHGQGGREKVSAGYHAIELILWGEGRDGRPGDRPPADFADARRAAFLLAAAAKLVSDLETPASAWSDSPHGASRARLDALPPDEAVGEIFSSVWGTTAIALAADGLAVPYQTKAPEDGQSRFSDTTRADLVEMARSAQNLYLGRFVGADGSMIEGTGLAHLVFERDPELSAHLEKQIEATIEAAKRIPQPFAKSIAGSDGEPGRASVSELLDLLSAQADSIRDAAALFGYELPDGPADAP